MLKTNSITNLAFVNDYIDKHCIFRANPNLQYVDGLPKGKIVSQYPKLPKNQSTWQFFMSRLTYNPVIMHLTAGLLFDMMVKDIGDNFISSKFQIVGMETSSIPLIVAIQQYALKYDVELNGFSIRKNRKNYGLFNLINGTPKTDEPFVMVDDLLNSGATFNACLDTCMYEFNIETAGACYSIVDISPNAVKDEDYNVFYNGEYIQVRSLFKKTEFNLEYDPEKYWFPYDCDKTFNKRPDYT